MLQMLQAIGSAIIASCVKMMSEYIKSIWIIDHCQIFVLKNSNIHKVFLLLILNTGVGAIQDVEEAMTADLMSSFIEEQF